MLNGPTDGDLAGRFKAAIRRAAVNLCRPTPVMLTLWLVAGSLVCLVAGLIAPSYTITPSFGDDVVDAIVLNYRPDIMRQRTFSIRTTIATLFAEGDIGLGLVIATFSCAFPAAKLLTIASLLVTAAYGDGTTPPIGGRRLRFLDITSHWSMLDVFVVAVLITGFKALPLGGTIERRWGLAAFGLSVVLTMICSSHIERLYKGHVKCNT